MNRKLKLITVIVGSFVALLICVWLACLSYSYLNPRSAVNFSYYTPNLDITDEKLTFVNHKRSFLHPYNEEMNPTQYLQFSFSIPQYDLAVFERENKYGVSGVFSCDSPMEGQICERRTLSDGQQVEMYKLKTEKNVTTVIFSKDKTFFLLSAGSKPITDAQWQAIILSFKLSSSASLPIEYDDGRARI